MSTLTRFGFTASTVPLPQTGGKSPLRTGSYISRHLHWASRVPKHNRTVKEAIAVHEKEFRPLSHPDFRLYHGPSELTLAKQSDIYKQGQKLTPTDKYFQDLLDKLFPMPSEPDPEADKPDDEDESDDENELQ